VSRAFTKEPDGSEVPEELTELPVSTYRNLVTAKGLNAIKQKQSDLWDRLEKAESENNMPLVGQLSRDLRYWNSRLASAELVPEQTDNEKIRFGHEVTLSLKNGKKKSFRIVGQDEADPSAGLLSYVSPIAVQLLGKSEGDTIELDGDTAEIVLVKN
jgi:transcription elongation GreA/GreB family factor